MADEEIGGRNLARDILVYADVDLNLIDGSAVWLASLTEMLSINQQLSVSVLLKRPLERDILVRNLLNRPNITFIDPWKHADVPVVQSVLSRLSRDVLDHAAAATLIQHIDLEMDAHRILVRGLDVVHRLCGDKRLANKLIAYITNPPDHEDFAGVMRLIAVHRSSRLTLLQTPMARDAFTELLGIRADRNKIDILNPMIPDDNFQVPIKRKRIPQSLGYSGKFSPPYMIEEMIANFRTIRNNHPRATFHVVGDKFLNKPFVEGFIERVKEQLQGEDGVIWYGGVSREKANELISSVMVASSWRDASFDSTVEISTKILEYAALGIPVLMRPAPVQIAVFGEQLPTWVETPDDFRSAFERLIIDPSHHQEVAASMREAVKDYAMSTTIQRLEKHF